jgi:hypothetical protein
MIGQASDRADISPETGSSRASLRWGFRTMPVSVPGHADHRFRDDGDHSFRDDPDQLIMIVGMVIAMPGNVFHQAR